MQEQIVARLVELGWTALGDNHTAIASKTYETAVGPKVAHAYLSKGDEYNRTLGGEYWSEGRNVLAGLSQLIPHGAELGLVQGAVDFFAADADKAIGDSYAARLLRK